MEWRTKLLTRWFGRERIVDTLTRARIVGYIGARRDG
jgi:hypothetical protein